MLFGVKSHEKASLCSEVLVPVSIIAELVCPETRGAFSINGIQLTQSSAIFQMTLVGYSSSQLRIILVGLIAWVGWYRSLCVNKKTKLTRRNPCVTFCNTEVIK
jgi:hypothetical protein